MPKTLKKVLAAALALGMLFACVSCGSDSGDSGA